MGIAQTIRNIRTKAQITTTTLTLQNSPRAAIQVRMLS